MCGIVAYIGKKEAYPILIKGLQRLEYRGYDSAGIAVLDTKKIQRVRAVGKIDMLAEKVKELNSALDLLNQVSQKVPGTRNIRLEVRRFIVDNNNMEIEGLIRNAQELNLFKQSLQALAADGRVQDFRSQVVPQAGQQAFGLRLKVNRDSGS